MFTLLADLTDDWGKHSYKQMSATGQGVGPLYWKLSLECSDDPYALWVFAIINVDIAS